MKKLFRGDVLAWIDSGGSALDVAVERARGEAARALAEHQGGTLAFAEPWLGGLVDRVAALDAEGERRIGEELSHIRARLRQAPSEPAPWPFTALARYTLPLPRAAKPGLTLFLPIGVERFLVLAREPTELPLAEGDTARRFRMKNRLFAMDSVASGLREVFAFDQAGDAETTLLLLHDGDAPHVVVGERLYRIGPSWSFELVCRFERANPAAERHVVQAAVMHGDGLLVCVEEDEDGCFLYGYSGKGVPGRAYGYAGHRGDALLVVDDAVYVSDLLCVRRVPLRRGAAVERDFSFYFSEFPHSPVEVVASLGDAIFISNGRKLLVVSKDLQEVRDEHVHPRECRTLHVVDDHLVCSHAEPRKGALVVEVWC
jgi:hypothetical protein